MKNKALLALAQAYNYLRRDERGQGHTAEIFGALVVAGLLGTFLYSQVPTIRTAIQAKINCFVSSNCQ